MSRYAIKPNVGVSAMHCRIYQTKRRSCRIQKLLDIDGLWISACILSWLYQQKDSGEANEPCTAWTAICLLRMSKRAFEKPRFSCLQHYSHLRNPCPMDIQQLQTVHSLPQSLEKRRLTLEMWNKTNGKFDLRTDQGFSICCCLPNCKLLPLWMSSLEEQLGIFMTITQISKKRLMMKIE